VSSDEEIAKLRAESLGRFINDANKPPVSPSLFLHKQQWERIVMELGEEQARKEFARYNVIIRD
jgi:hypothetical protein